jgi:ppGpp synthetase/RelA/SpoT-type nucleotidyltranferase
MTCRRSRVKKPKNLSMKSMKQQYEPQHRKAVSHVTGIVGLMIGPRSNAAA